MARQVGHRAGADTLEEVEGGFEDYRGIYSELEEEGGHDDRCRVEDSCIS